MNIKIYMHLMPWELDDASNVFNKIAIANKYLSPDDQLTIDTCLNLSSYIIDWDKSIIPKEFYINKYNYISKVFYEINHKCNIYDKNELYGHLDFQREVQDPNIDYYIQMCSDVYFHPHTIFYLIESAKKITTKYFLITPEIPKLWDQTWDVLTNKNFINEPYETWENRNINEIIYISETMNESPYFEKINQFKWAGWLDLYNKNFHDTLIPSHPDWHGYGPWDFYGLHVCNIAKYNFNIDVAQYVLRNQIIFDKDIGIFQNKKNPSVYKKYLSLNTIPNQRVEFESKMEQYIRIWHENLKRNNIL